MYAKVKVYLNLTCYVYEVFYSSVIIVTLTFNCVMIFFIDLHGGELKYAYEYEAEDDNER